VEEASPLRKSSPHTHLPDSTLANLVTSIGRIQFGQLIEARENPNSGKFEWQVGFLLSEEESASIIQACEAAADARREQNPKYPATNTLRFPYSPAKTKDENGVLVDLEGHLTWKFKRAYTLKDKATGGDKPNTPPAIYDGMGRVLNNTPGMPPAIPPGTTGTVVYDVYAYDMAGSKGVSLQLKGFQIFEMAKSESVIAPIEGGWTPAEEMDDIGAALLADA
jgi:hypothetical protein